LSVLLALILVSPACTTTEKLVEFEEYTYSGVYLDISNETENARASHWRPDGGEIFVVGRFTGNVASYTVTEPWNLKTATFSSEFDLSNEFGSTEQLSRAHGLYLQNDGGKMWVFNRTEIWGYSLSDPWDIVTATATQYKDLSEFVLRGHDFDFHPDGNRLYIDDRDAQAVHEVRLNTPWDITTIEWVYTLDISDYEEEVRGIEIVADGKIMLLVDTVRRELLQFRMEEPWDLKSAVYHSAFDLSGQSDNPRGLSIRPDLEWFYITGNDHQKIYQYRRNSASFD